MRVPGSRRSSAGEGGAGRGGAGRRRGVAATAAALVVLGPATRRRYPSRCGRCRSPRARRAAAPGAGPPGRTPVCGPSASSSREKRGWSPAVRHRRHPLAPLTPHQRRSPLPRETLLVQSLALCTSTESRDHVIRDDHAIRERPLLSRGRPGRPAPGRGGSLLVGRGLIPLSGFATPRRGPVAPRSPARFRCRVVGLGRGWSVRVRGWRGLFPDCMIVPDCMITTGWWVRGGFTRGGWGLLSAQLPSRVRKAS